MATLFDNGAGFSTAVDQLMHLPEAIEKLVFPSSTRSSGCRHDPRQQQQDRQQGQEKDTGNAPVDVLETQKAYTFFLDVPGLSKSDIQVTVEDESVLVISGSNGKRKREDSEEEGCKYLRLERRASTKFTRKFRLPEDADASAITARCENGVLTVVVGKRPPPETPKPKTVEVSIA